MNETNLKKTTDDLLKVLNNLNRTEDLEDYLGNIDSANYNTSFPEYYCSLPEVASLDKTDLIQRSGIERTYFYQLLNGTRKPGRDKVIALCIAAGLDLKHTQRALELSNLAILYSKNRRDAIIIFCINKHLSNVDTEELLDRLGEDVL
ncbi:MAG: XRE family transcriptional regulator [Lachnospiraceae bacterium]|nr:XRE family transcriptional regulator [Lachnospiraceae bacterium]